MQGAKLAARPTDQSPAHAETAAAAAAPESRVTQPQRAGKRRLNKQERLAEKAAAEAAAQRWALLRYGSEPLQSA